MHSLMRVCTSHSIQKSKQAFVRRSAGGARRQTGNSSQALQTVYEVSSMGVLCDSQANLANTTTISPAGLLLSSRLAGYMAVADEVRLDRVDIEFIPVLGRGASGRCAAYIERDPTAAAVATVDLASDQRESVAGNASQKFVLHWRPQEPLDREFNLLNPGTVSLGSVILLGTQLADPGVPTADMPNRFVYMKKIHVWMTIRGRP